ncbi:MAG TPA: stage 0 sporulation protein [Thermodesulfatator atlanticus]|uniref:Stage 0 sporulation protein n=1 Tax=Thermodesulfatator atlanticus TaxID=501497 RepID=A0A7V5P1L8_9BACT|nr:stage 0 sporulation protein [Thermodesulfatator atlanticus]
MKGKGKREKNRRNVKGGASNRRPNKNKEISRENKKAHPLVAEVVLREGYPGFHALVEGAGVRPGDLVLVSFGERKEVGRVVSPVLELSIPLEGLPRVLRLANPKEVARYQENIAFEKKAWSVCEQLARELGLEMKLVRVERLYDRSKVIFYYTAEGRIDFRQLVKDLVRALRTRIEMRQIGVRHEAGMIGGVGCCGREICCAAFLKKFDPVSIKIAKEQSLPLDPVKISGLCGRLLCCLLYEHNVYAELSASLPKIGKKVSLANYEGRVVRYNIFRHSVTIETSEGDEVEIPLEDFAKER